MKKRVLMLSAATAALVASQALADTELKTVVTTAQSTSTTGNLLIDSAGGINFKSTTVPILTINSGISGTPVTVNNGGAITGTDTSTEVGIFVDGTKNPFGSFTNNGTIDLTGAGTGKIGMHLSGAGSFNGPITFDTGSIVKIAGDSSTGISQDAGFLLNGDLSFGGTFTMSPTTANGTAASSIALANLGGTINGNVLITTGSALTVVGNDASGFNVTGAIQACNTAVTPGCTEIGTFANSGTISVVGVATRSSTVANAESGTALTLGNNIAGGFLNNGQNGADGVVNGVISANGVLAATLVISPSILSTGVTLGPVTGDANGTYGFINRGSIVAGAEDNNASTVDVSISGNAAQLVNIAGGIFNSGVMSAQSTSVSPGNPTNSTALQIGEYVTIPTIYVSEEGLATSGNGHIEASVSGTQGGTATAILIGGAPVSGTVVTHVSNIVIETNASVFASATVTDPTLTTVTTLNAIAIEDRSNSLATITNSGAITAQTTTLTNGSTAQAIAVDVSLNTQGLAFVNNGTVAGSVLFGSGNSSYTLTGTGATLVANQTGAINFAGGTDALTLNSFSSVTGAVTSEGTLSVTVADNATLSLQNIVTSSLHSNLEVMDFTTTGGNLSTVDVTVTGGLATTPLVQASHQIVFSPGTNFNVTFGSFIPAGGTFELLSAPSGGLVISAGDIANYQLAVNGSSRPFLFNSSTLSKVTIGGNDILELTVIPKTEAELGLTGYAAQLFPVANQAAAGDNTLGAALVAGINSAADAETAYNAFAPDVSGGTRAVAISLTDQATGVVAARQRELRLFSKEPGELTLWGNEFGEYMSTHGQTLTGTAGRESPNVCAAANCTSGVRFPASRITASDSRSASTAARPTMAGMAGVQLLHRRRAGGSGKPRADLQDKRALVSADRLYGLARTRPVRRFPGCRRLWQPQGQALPRPDHSGFGQHRDDDVHARGRQQSRRSSGYARHDRGRADEVRLDLRDAADLARRHVDARGGLTPKSTAEPALIWP